jgi:hypothetical protein
MPGAASTGFLGKPTKGPQHRRVQLDRYTAGHGLFFDPSMSFADGL